jgi:hypothetical protein
LLNVTMLLTNDGFSSPGSELMFTYAPLALVLILVTGYYLVAVMVIRFPEKPRVVVERYEPPKGVSPAIASWLFEPGDLPRAIAAALMNMAAKGFLRIEQKGDLYSIIRQENFPSVPQEPEEHVLTRYLLDDCESFDFVEPTTELQNAVIGFRNVLHNTDYFSSHTAISATAWAASVAAIAYMLFNMPKARGDGRFFFYDLALTFGCFIITARTARGPIDKVLSRMPWSTAPKRPWSGADSLPLTFLAATVVGVSVLALITSPAFATITAAFMLVNAIFLHALEGPTALGREAAEPLEEYKKFLSEVDADAISRTDSADVLPPKFTQKGAYAVAFHLDIGWGEQFVTSIADLVEYADVFKFHRSSS